MDFLRSAGSQKIHKKIRRNAMNPKKHEKVEPKADASFGPFSEPRTIPGGWDVSAFFAPEQALQVLPEALPAPELTDDSEDTLS
jgi:hypothetical protein